jgi:hypothetical protein
MNASVSAFRAITSVIFQQMLKPASWIALGVVVLLYILVCYIALSVSAWWFLILIVLMPLTLVVASLFAALWYLAKRLMPRPLLPSETARVSDMVGKVRRLLEARATPLPMIMFLIAKDVVRGKGSSYIENIVVDSKGLKDDFTAIKSIFEPKKIS